MQRHSNQEKINAVFAGRTTGKQAVTSLKPNQWTKEEKWLKPIISASIVFHPNIEQWTVSLAFLARPVGKDITH